MQGSIIDTWNLERWNGSEKRWTRKATEYFTKIAYPAHVTSNCIDFTWNATDNTSNARTINTMPNTHTTPTTSETTDYFASNSRLS